LFATNNPPPPPPLPPPTTVTTSNKIKNTPLNYIQKQYGGKRGRASSPDITPKQKKPRPGTPSGTTGHKYRGGYNSPLRVLKNDVKRKIEQWDPNRLTDRTKFIMGTRANKALGLGATRGRIYMKHPELFKYAGDADDKKWMVKNQCMAATGGKNAFIMIFDEVLELYEAEYKDSSSAISEELIYFNLPQFTLDKMKDFMVQKKAEELQRIADAARAKMEADLQAKLEPVPSPLSYVSSPPDKKMAKAMHGKLQTSTSGKPAAMLSRSGGGGGVPPLPQIESPLFSTPSESSDNCFDDTDLT